jgi:hypothetical protein
MIKTPVPARVNWQKTWPFVRQKFLTIQKPVFRAQFLGIGLWGSAFVAQ